MAEPLWHGSPLPSPPNTRWLWLRVVQADGPFHAIILGDRITGLWTHWDGRAAPCAESADCPLCKAGKAPRWSGFIPVWSVGPGRVEILQVSESCARDLLPFLERHKSLRGLLFRFTRANRVQPNSRLVPVFVEKREPTALPPAPDMWPSILRTFGLNGEWLAAHNLEMERRAKSAPPPSTALFPVVSSVEVGTSAPPMTGKAGA